MVHDYWMHRDDPEFVRGFLPGVRSVARLVRAAHRREPASLGPMPWWPYVDWATEWPVGVPPGGRDGHSTLITPAVRLRARARGRAGGRPRAAGRGRALTAALADSLRAPRASQGLGRRRAGSSATRPNGAAYSQQTNIMAVLVDAVPPPSSARSWSACSRTPTLTQSTYYYGFYLLRGAAEGGPRRSLRRAARAVAGDAGDGPHHRPRDPRAHALRLARLERPPQLRPARHRPRRAAGRAGLPLGADRAAPRSAAARARVASRTRSATSRCGSSAQGLAASREKSRSPRA